MLLRVGFCCVVALLAIALGQPALAATIASVSSSSCRWQSGANVQAAHPSAGVLYGCPIPSVSLVVSLVNSIPTSFPSSNVCVQGATADSVTVNSATFAVEHASTTGSGASSLYNVRLRKTGTVNPGDVYRVTIPSTVHSDCNNGVEYVFYFHFAGAPSISGQPTLTTTTPLQYCSLTNDPGQSAGTYISKLTDCYYGGDAVLTLTGANLFRITVSTTEVGIEHPMACYNAFTYLPSSPSGWNTNSGTAGGGTVQGTTTAHIKINSRAAALAAPQTNFDTYIEGTECDLSSAGLPIDTHRVSVSYFSDSPTTTITSITGNPASLCSSSGNNAVGCKILGGGTLTFTGTNFGPIGAPMLVTATDLCTTTSLTRVSETVSTCTLAAGAAGAVRTPTIVALGTSASGISGPTASYGSPSVTSVSCSGCGCAGLCDLNGDSSADSLCGCTNSEDGATEIGAISVIGTNLAATGLYSGCMNGQYSSSDGSTGTCTGLTGTTNTTLPVGSFSAAIQYVSNSFSSGPTVVNPPTFSSGVSYLITVRFTPRRSGTAHVYLVPAGTSVSATDMKNTANAYSSACAPASNPISVTGGAEASVTITCASPSGFRAHVYAEGSDARPGTAAAYGKAAESSTSVAVATITSITSGSCRGTCTVSSTSYLCGCPVNGPVTITVTGTSFTAQTSDSGLCDGSITFDSSLQFRCTLKSGTALLDSFVTSALVATQRVYFLTNAFANTPAFSPQSVSFSSRAGSVNSFSATVSFRPRVNGKAYVRITAAGTTLTEQQVKDGTGPTFRSCTFTQGETITANVDMAVTLTGCPLSAGDIAHVYIEGNTIDTVSTYFGSVAVSTNSALLPVVITSVTSSQCTARCTIGAEEFPCGCPTSGVTITVNGDNLSGTSSDSGLCSGAVTLDGSNAFYTCTLRTGTAGQSVTSSHSGVNNKVFFVSNAFSAAAAVSGVTYTGNLQASTHVYTVTLTFTPLLAGNYSAAVVLPANDAAYGATNGGAANVRGGTGTTACTTAALVSVSSLSLTTITLTNCGLTAEGAFGYVYLEGSTAPATTGTDGAVSKTSAISRPIVLRSVSMSALDADNQRCVAQCGTDNRDLCGCALTATRYDGSTYPSRTLTITGLNFKSTGMTEATACQSGTIAYGTETEVTCYLADGAQAGTAAAVRIVHNSLTFTGPSVNYVTNAFTTAPTISSVPAHTGGNTVFSVTFTPQVNGIGVRVFAVAYTDNAADPTKQTIRSNGATASSSATLCAAAPLTTVPSGAVTIAFSCETTFGLNIVDDANANVIIYVEGIEGGEAGYGTRSARLQTRLCHSDCKRCTRARSADFCAACYSGTHISGSANNATVGFCCHETCKTCTLPTGGTTALGANACLTCFVKTDVGKANYKADHFHLSHNTAAPTFCCHSSCSTCNGVTINDCLSCGGRNSKTGPWETDSSITTGQCKDKNGFAGGVEINGDPHFHGILDQDYTITGRPSAVYSIISDSWLQYNTRFIWYGDVYHGFDPTTEKPYDANVTYIGEVGMKFNWGDREDRVHIDIQRDNVTLNGAAVGVDKVALAFGVDCAIARTTKYVDVTTPRFRVRFFRSGPRQHPFINQRVELISWPHMRSHGLLGQTWKAEQRQGINRNAIWEGHQAGVDFQFRSAEFLEGRLADYEVQEADVFGDTFTYNQYHFGK